VKGKARRLVAGSAGVGFEKSSTISVMYLDDGKTECKRHRGNNDMKTRGQGSTAGDDKWAGDVNHTPELRACLCHEDTINVIHLIVVVMAT
jgi:hypothetical protein